MKKFFLVIFTFVLFFLHTKDIQAEKDSQFITIVNPVRISAYTKNPKESLSAQYEVISEKKLPATWLLTYDAILDGGIYLVTKSMNKDQELGIFLEVAPNFAKEAGVTYHDTGFWHHANSVFLSGYTQDERKKLIDTLFKEFNKKFGFYPTSVGSWWTDSFSLDYMKQKYGITANLTVSDQFSTDGYQVWGQYFGAPFYPSKFHSGIPSPDVSVKLDVVNLQWAPRDPLNGYKSSLYSTQDYKLVNLDIEFFEWLVNLYARAHENNFGQITIGLEGDLPADAYSGEFEKQMSLAKGFQESGEFTVTNMRQFSKWYRESYPGLSPPYKIVTDDFFQTDRRVIWYQSPRFRIGVLFETRNKKAEIFDFRTYHADLIEPYYFSPNREFELSIYIPSHFDEIQTERSGWTIEAKEEDFVFTPEKILIKKLLWSPPSILKQNPAVSVKKYLNKTELVPQKEWLAGKESITFNWFSVETIHFLKEFRSSLKLVFGVGWEKVKFEKYFISQGEIDALFHLSKLPPGKTLVYDKECLQCSWHTPAKPAVFANLRSYVKKIGKQPIVKNQKVFEESSREESKKEFEKTAASYVYLVKFEDYRERIPFSPGDLGVEKIYDNANAEIWEVKQ